MGFKGLTVPAGGFTRILADPNWLYNVRSKKGEKKSPQRHYECMPIEQIAALPVKDIAAENCVLFLWVTWPMLLKTEMLSHESRTPGVGLAYQSEQNVINYVLRSWGFDYSGLAWEWIKTYPNRPRMRESDGTPIYSEKDFFNGLGYTSRKNCEPCIIAKRGNIGLPMVRNIPDRLFAPVRQHSRKPDEQYERINKMYAGPAVELFAVEGHEGWSSWNPKKHRRTA